MTKRPKLEVQDSTGLTDRDWAEISKLQSANERSEEALNMAIGELAQKDFFCFLKVAIAFGPSSFVRTSRILWPNMA
jgi:hypothetical protein